MQTIEAPKITYYEKAPTADDFRAALGMTENQARAVEAVIEQGRLTRNYIVKRWSASCIHQASGLFFVTFMMAPEGKDNPLLERHWSGTVTPRGKLVAMDAGKGRKSRARRYPAIYGWRDFGC